MKTLLFISTLSYSFKASAINFCDAYSKDLVGILQSKAENGDVTDYVEIAGLQCPSFTVDKLITAKKMTSVVWKSILKKGYMNQINYHTSRAMSYAEYGKVETEDFEQLGKYGKLLNEIDGTENINLAEQMGFINQLKKLNKANQTKKTSCSTKDYRKKLGPIRDQTNMDWCYSFVAADLLSAKMNSRISAASLSALYSQFANGGHGTDARGRPSEILRKTIEYAKNIGACSEANFPSEFESQRENYVENLRAFMKRNYSKEKSSKLLPKQGAMDCSHTILLATPQKRNYSNLQEIHSNVFNDQDLQSFEQMACKNRFRVPKVTVETVPDNGSPTLLLEKIDKLIDTETPVGMNYYSGFLKEPTSTQMKPHASIVVGRKLDTETGKCEYLIRNSWGKNCQKMPGILPEKCEEGYFWVPREELHRHIIDAVYLK